jgi:hypothetical protein
MLGEVLEIISFACQACLISKLLKYLEIDF